MRRSVLVLCLLSRRSPRPPRPRAPEDTTLSLVALLDPDRGLPEARSPPTRRRPPGKGVKFPNSFAASEVQSKAVAAGLPADVVNFSISTDMDRLVDAKLVDKSWATNKYHGIVSKSVVVFVLRNGNPKHIKTWDDLVKPGVDVVFPNPFSSGGARWDVMAAYGAMLREGKTPKQARRVPDAALPAQRLAGHERPQRAQHVPRRARATCCSTYESDAKLAQSQGKPVFYADPEGDAADRDAARRRQRRQQGGGDEVRQLALHAGGADDLGAERLPAGRPERREASTRSSSRRGRSSSRSATSAAGTR